MSDIAQENPVSPLFIWFASIAAGEKQAKNNNLYPPMTPRAEDFE